VKQQEVPGIKFDRLNAPHPTVDSDNAPYYLEFDKTDEYFDYFDNQIAFIKNVEKLVRKHTFIRSTYPKYLKEIVGLKECEVMPGIKADDKGKITLEMHHGPILTLFDTCEIVMNAWRARGATNVNTFTIANEVIEQHRLNNVRVMFLCKSAHQKVHEEGIFLNYRQGFGDTLRFLELFKDGVDKDMRIKINEYLAWSIEHDSTDSNIMRLADTMKEWGNNDFDEFDTLSLS
jgi:hypothetical protein